MRRCFREFDRDGDGTIDRAELGEALAKSNLTAAEVDRIMALSDKDGSSRLSYEEFIAQVFK